MGTSLPPLAPYPVFAGWDPSEEKDLPIRSPDGTKSFEPSAIVAYPDPKTGREQLLVLNDFFDPSQYRYRLKADGSLVQAKRAPRVEMTLEGSKERFAPKFEAIAPLKSGRFLALTPFNRPEEALKKVYSFAAPNGPTAAREVPLDSAGLIKFIQTWSGQPWFQMEGLAVDAAESQAIFGVRFTGESREGKKSPTVSLVRSPLKGEAIGAPASVARFTTLRALGREEGLADLQRDPTDGSYLLLTSYEGTDVTDLANNQGALFRLPAELVERGEGGELPPPLARFDAKCEGVTVLKDGRIVVIFDDDREWKDNFQGYARSEALYTVLDREGRTAADAKSLRA